jgi:hypothetical protein
MSGGLTMRAAALAAFGVLAASPAIGAEPLPPGATILSWTPEQQLVGYRHMEEIDPARVIRRGPQVRALPKAPVQIDPKWTWKGHPYDVASWMTALRTSGVIVLKDGKVVLER